MNLTALTRRCHRVNSLLCSKLAPEHDISTRKYKEKEMKKVIAGIVFILMSMNAYAGGLLGDAINLVAPGVGTKLDEEHRRIKDANPGYKRLEEGVTETVKRPFTVACTIPYQTLTSAVIAKCSNWGGRLDDQHIIQQAKQRLINAGIFSAHEFNGVQIRWCPLYGAHGMAPDRGRIYLDTSAKNDDPNALSALLAHEMKHVQQYRRMGTDNFKCDYSKKYTACGGCQDRGHPLEREAYDFESNVYNRLVASDNDRYNATPGYGYTQPSYQPALSNKCGTNMGSCFIGQVGQIGTTCWCNSMYGPIYGNLIP